MNIAITGASGFLGSALVRVLVADGHTPRRLVRRRPAAGSADIEWHPAQGTIDAAALEGVDAVVHLAGENLAQYWTPGARRRIRDSRVNGTRLLAETVARLQRPPALFLSGSAVGYYGDRGDELLDEGSARGAGFLADVTRAWEDAAAPAAAAGVRVLHLRTGLVLAPWGGVLAKMLLPFRLGLGGRVGSGDQWVSWIALADWVGAVRHLLAAPVDAGPVNLVAPTPVRNDELTHDLGETLGRPTFLRVPALAVRALLGDMGTETLLASQRVRPARLTASGFAFRWPQLAPALAEMLRGTYRG